MEAAISSTDIGATVPSFTPRDFAPATRRQVDLLDTNAVLAGDIAPGPINSLTILIPVMNEEGNLPELYARLLSSLDAIGLPFEIIFVDDGSSDETWNLVSDMSARDPRVIGLKHRRNFGKAQALSNGFAVARGDVVVTMDGDLQDDPDELQNFLTMLDEGYDLVGQAHT